MRARLIFLPIFFAIQFLFSSNTIAQGNISGPVEVCLGDCSTYSLDSIPNPNFLPFWSIVGPGGNSFFSEEYPLTYCWEFPGNYIIYVEYESPNGNGFAEYSVFVSESFFGEIISDSSCPSQDSSATAACEQACAFSTVTYSIPGSNSEINWNITGADDFIISGNSVEVEWGEPGTGLVEASVYSNTPLDIYCNNSANCGIAGCFPFAYVDVNGGTPPYTYLWEDGSTTSTINNIEFWNEYEVSVTDASGQTGTCNVFVEDQCVYPSIIADIQNASTCGSCDARIILNSFNFTGFDNTYYWSDGSTEFSRSNLCPGTYVFTVENALGCSINRTFVIGCDQTSCEEDLSLCVEILEEPEAAFSTTPPIENGVLNICEGQTVYFTNESSNAQHFTWDFGPGQSFNDVNSFYTYTTAGTYQVSLIAANTCFCADTTTLTVIVEDAIGPQVDCVGTICEGEVITYTSSDDCGIFNWIVSGNGNITDGGGTSDDFVTIEWGAGPIGTIELAVENCTGDYCSEPTIAQVPIISDNAEIEGPDRVCNFQTATYAVPLYSGTEYFWSVTNRGTIESGLNTNEITVKWESNSIPVTGQFITVEFMNCYLGCGGQDTLFIDLLPEYYLGGPIEACENEVTDFSAFNAVTDAASVNANWTVYAPDGSVAETSSTPSTTFSATWTAGAGQYRIEIQAANIQDYCTDSYEIKVDVIAPPSSVSAIDGATEICPGQPYAYTATTATPANAFRWAVNNGGTITEVMGNPITVIWGNTAPYELTVSEISVTGPACASSPYSVTYSTIQNVSITETADACRDEVTIYNASSFTDLNYDWSIVPEGAGTVVEGQNTTAPTVLWHQAGNFDVQLDICGLTEIFTVEVHDKPNPTVLYPTGLCANETEVIQTSTLFTTYSWRNESGVEVSTDPDPALSPGYYELVVTDNFGCEEDTTFFIDPYPVPTISISTPDDTWYCPGDQEPTLYAVNTDDGYQYQWFYNNAPIGGNTPTILGDQFGQYYVEVTDQNGCVDFSNRINVKNFCLGDTIVCNDTTCPLIPLCAGGTLISFDKNYPNPICNERSYTNTSSNYIPGTLYWTFDDPESGDNFSTDDNPTHVYSQAGFFTVLLRGQSPDLLNPPNTKTCWDAMVDTILLAADFDVDNSCPGSITSFTDISTFLPFTSIASWSWDFGDPASGVNNISSDQHPTHVFDADGNYTVTLTATDASGCISIKTKTITVNPIPTVNFADPMVTCQATSMNFILDGSSNITSVVWDFGDPSSGEGNNSTLEDTYHSFNTPGNYTVTLTATNIYGCSNAFSKVITVEPNTLTGNVTLSQASPLCEGETTTLTAPSGGVSWLWSTNGTTENITVATEEVYVVTITNSEGCTYVPQAVVVDIIPAPDGTIRAVEYDDFGQPINLIDDAYELCEGDNVFMEILEVTNYSYVWTGNETGNTIEFSDDRGNLLSEGNYDFYVTITDNTTGCTSITEPFIVTVHGLPADFTISASETGPICANTSTTFTVNSPDPTLTYLWSNGETGTSITSSEAGAYFAKAINSFGCEKESNQLTILPGPNINRIPAGCHTRCNPDTICLPPMAGVVSYQWYLNGIIIPAPEGTIRDLIATESGTYQLEMTDNIGCVVLSDPLTLDLYDGYGNINGEVYSDVNHNGIIDGADTLLTDVTIILNDGINDIDTVTTNANGAYFFNNILSTNYSLLVDTVFLETGSQVIGDNPVDLSLVGCDVEETLDWLIDVDCSSTSSSLSLNTCAGAAVTYNGMMISPGAPVDVVLTNSSGCDSIIMVQVIDNPTHNFIETIQSCSGTSITYDGINILAGANETFTYTNQYGCDSTILVDVIANPLVTQTINLSACDGDFQVFDGVNILAGSQEVFNYATTNGCDSILTVNVIENPIGQSDLTLEACQGSTVMYNGLVLNPGSSQDIILQNQFLCDSTVSVTVVENLIYNELETMQACQGSAIVYDGVSVAAGSQEIFNYATINGCDSTITVEVMELEINVMTENYSTCEGSDYIYDGVVIAAGGQEDFTYTNQNGCDSTVTVMIALNPLETSIENYSACEGSDYIYDGVAIAAGGEEDFTYTNQNGCDSTVTVMIALNPLETSIENYSACEGSDYIYDGVSIAAGAQEDFTYTNQNGCDSTVTVMIALNPLETSIENYSACSGSDFIYDGVSIAAGSQEDFTYTNQNGCDSVVTVMVQELVISQSIDVLETCLGSTANYHGEELPVGTLETYTFTNQFGCDSIVEVSVLSYTDFDFILEANEVCRNTWEGEINVAEMAGGTPPFLYQIEGMNQQDSARFTSLPPGIYNIEIEDGNGCIREDQIEVMTIGGIVVEMDDTELSCDVEGVMLTPEVSGNVDGLSFVWQDGSTGNTFFAEEPGNYWVEASNVCGSQKTESSVKMEVNGQTSFLYMPNVFSPNSDGVNDQFRAFSDLSVDVKNYSLEVFDRWGNKVYTTNDMYAGWNGKKGGKRINPGVFIYQVSATIESCGRTIEVFESGDVTLLR